MPPRRRPESSGTTLVELLVAVIFLGFCVSALLASISQAHSTAGHARHRLIALGLADDQIEDARVKARTGELAAGTTSNKQTDTGIPGEVTVTRTVSAVPGFSGLFAVKAVVTWDDRISPAPREEKLVAETLVRSPDV